MPSSSGARPIAAHLRADAARAIAAAAVSAAALAVVELIATLIAAPRLPDVATLLRFVCLDLTLCALLAPPLALAYLAAAALARLVARVILGERAAAWPGLFAAARPGDRAPPWLLGAALGAAAFVALATATIATVTAAYKEKTLAALVAAALLLAVVALAGAIGWLTAAGLARLGPRLDARLGRLSPLGYRPATVALLTVLALGGLAIVVRALPALRSLVPWRHLLGLAAIIAGAELYASLFGPRRWLVPRGRRARRLVLAGLLAFGLVLAPLTLVRLGADAATKAFALAASPPLASLIDAVRRGNDFDRDGYGSLLGENDCAPFDRARHPLARDLPDNRIDENCDGRDFVLGRLPRYKKGERMPVPAAYQGPWNVLLLTVDTVRYDHTTMGGYKERRGRDTTPNLARLAARSVSFAFANAPSAGTMASVPAILTSRFFHSGIALGEERRGMPPKLKPSNLMLAEVMQRAGYVTGAILSHEYFNDWGMEQGFSTYDNSIGEKPDPFRVTSDRLTDRALAWIGEHARRRWFLWVHYIDPHGRYVAHPGETSYGSSEEDLYDGELAFTDKHVGRLLAELERLPGGDRTVIIVTSDHGDAFNEHGFINHAQALYFELLHVPLIVYVPNVEPRLVEGPVSPLDILPTLADLAGVSVDDQELEGESLVPQLFYGKDARDRVVFAETNYPKPIRAVVADGWKLVYKLKDNAYELFDLKKDPREQKNLWPGGEPAAFERLKGYLDDWLERVYYARDPEANQTMAKLRDVLLDAVPTPRQALAASFDGGAIEVLGVDVDAAGARPGDKLDVAVYLRTVRRPSADFLFQVEARPTDPTRAPRSTTSLLRATAQGALPTSRWRDGEFIRDRFQVRVPQSWAGGAIVLGLRVADAQRKATPVTGAKVAGAPELLRLVEVPVAQAPVTPGTPPGKGIPPGKAP